MKVLWSMLIAGCGISVVTGCVAPAKNRPQATPASAVGAARTSNRTAPDAPTGANLAALPPGNPEAYAHFATGISDRLNGKDEKALDQFYIAALDDPGHEELVFELAEIYLRSGQFQKAADVLSKSVRRPNASAALFADMARAQLALDHPSEALAWSKKAIDRQRTSLVGYDSQAQIYFHTQQWSEAARTLHRAATAIQSQPASLVALANLYVSYLKNQPNDAQARVEAQAVLDRTTTLRIDSPYVWQKIAETYSALDLSDKAAGIYKRLLSEYPDDPEDRDAVDAIHEKLAIIYLRANQATNAMKELQTLVRDNPTHYPRAWFFLGELAYTTGQLQPAIFDYQNALRSDPSMEQAYYELTLAQLDARQSDAAFATLNQARERFPRTFPCEFYTAVAYMHITNYSEAIHHFKEAEVIAAASDKSKLDQRFYFQFGAACERAKEYDRAEDYLRKCIQKDPKFAEALNYLGYMLADLGRQLPQARDLIERAVKLEPKNGAYLDSLGWVLFKMHQAAQALPLLLKAQALSPEPDPTVLDHLGEVYMALHQPDKAMQAWKKSLSIESNEEIKHKLDTYFGGS